jgi:secondary thiamine-phosphate synthase enzyme
MVKQEEFELATAGHREVQDVTPQVTAIVRKSGIKVGIAHVFVQGSTGGMGIMECERGLKQDLPRLLDTLAPQSPDYAHEQTWHDGNGHSHLQATLLGQSVTFPVTDGAPALGTWQQVFLVECDIRPRHRVIVVTVIGDA